MINFDTIEYPYKGMEYANSATLYIAQLNKSDESIIIYNKIDPHIEEQKTISVELPQDGYYTLCQIILPKSIEGQGYFTDGTILYFKDSQGNIKEVKEQEIIEVNPEAYGFAKVSQNLFSVYYLRKCFISLCQKIFNDRGFDRCFNGKVDSQLTYKRDLVWAALNVIQYMIDSNQLAEAQRLLERIITCNGLCSSEDTGENKCGCK